MTVKPICFMSAVILAISLTSCATSDPSDDFNFDYASAEIGTFDGIWEGDVDCRYSNGFKPEVWVRISDGRGQFAFGNRLTPAGSWAYLGGSLYADLDLQNGEIKWRGKLQPWAKADGGVPKMPISFRGHWRESKLKLKGRIDKSNCSGMITKTSS